VCNRNSDLGYYPGDGVVVSLPCTNLDSAAKRLKESDMVVTHPGNSFDSSSDFENTKTTGIPSLTSPFREKDSI